MPVTHGWDSLNCWFFAHVFKWSSSWFSNTNFFMIIGHHQQVLILGTKGIIDWRFACPTTQCMIIAGIWTITQCGWIPEILFYCEIRLGLTRIDILKLSLFCFGGNVFSSRNPIVNVGNREVTGHNVEIRKYFMLLAGPISAIRKAVQLNSDESIVHVLEVYVYQVNFAVTGQMGDALFLQLRSFDLEMVSVQSLDEWVFTTALAQKQTKGHHFSCALISHNCEYCRVTLCNDKSRRGSILHCQCSTIRSMHRISNAVL